MDRKEWKEWTAGVVVTGRTGLRNHLLRALYGKSDIARVVCTAMAILGILPGESSPGNSKFPRNLAALEILSVDSQETWNCCHQMSDFKAKMHQSRFRLGLCPRPRWGSLQRSQDPLDGFKRPTSRGGKRGKGKEDKGAGTKRRGWKGRSPGSFDPLGCRGARIVSVCTLVDSGGLVVAEGVDE